MVLYSSRHIRANLDVALLRETPRVNLQSRGVRLTGGNTVLMLRQGRMTQVGDYVAGRREGVYMLAIDQESRELYLGKLGEGKAVRVIYRGPG
jgi:hypothetical protein